MLDILKIVYVIVVVVLMFGASIFIHEFGHFWMARRRGLKVEEFAIGFGPKIFGWTRDGVLYSWRWLPFGGYVKLPQMVTSEELEGKTAEQENLPPVSAFSKILVAFAGPIMNVVFAYIIATVIFFTGVPVAVNPAIVGVVDPKSTEAAIGIQERDRVISVDGKPVKFWDEVQMVAILARTNIVELVVQRGEKQLTFHVPLTVNTNLHLKMLELDPLEHPIARTVLPDRPAIRAGLTNLDEFVSFAGVPVLGRQQLMDLIHSRAGEPTEMVVKRGDKRIALMVTPDGQKGSGKGLIGVEFSESHMEIQHPTPHAQVAMVWNQMVNMLGALFHSKETGVGVKDVSGPPGIFAMLIAQILTDLRLGLSFLVMLNINLAVLNLFPIPVLDGGHIVMALIEQVTRRKLNVKVVEWVTTCCALMVISFILFVSFNDVRQRGPMFWNRISSSFKKNQPAQAITVPDKPATQPVEAPQPAPAK